MSTIEKFTRHVNTQSGARRVLYKIPAYRARQLDHLEQIRPESKHAAPVSKALSQLPALERKAIFMVGENAAEKILTKAEERLARR